MSNTKIHPVTLKKSVTKVVPTDLKDEWDTAPYTLTHITVTREGHMEKWNKRWSVSASYMDNEGSGCDIELATFPFVIKKNMGIWDMTELQARELAEGYASTVTSVMQTKINNINKRRGGMYLEQVSLETSYEAL